MYFEDFVISSGKMYTVRKFIELCALKLGWNGEKGVSGIVWEGKGLDEVGIREDTKEIVIKIDKKYFRPCEVNTLIGDASKANTKLGWEPKINLEELVSEMIKSDKELAKKESLLIRKGFKFSIPKE